MSEANRPSTRLRTGPSTGLRICIIRKHKGCGSFLTAPYEMTCSDLTFRVKTRPTRFNGGRATWRRCAFLRETTRGSAPLRRGSGQSFRLSPRQSPSTDASWTEPKGPRRTAYRDRLRDRFFPSSDSLIPLTVLAPQMRRIRNGVRVNNLQVVELRISPNKRPTRESSFGQIGILINRMNQRFGRKPNKFLDDAIGKAVNASV